ncbi:hypothetical protein [Actinoplanes sp. N902-109]|uniref:hypothetical protein n=1 Tax=Actinoplanes sp. (strain N902-109) TaxID=649831 RepID=UPI0012F9E083|nr:hypothetical protein [Actinoplanes sp. N902-109]
MQLIIVTGLGNHFAGGDQLGDFLPCALLYQGDVNFRNPSRVASPIGHSMPPLAELDHRELGGVFRVLGITAPGDARGQ